MRSFWRGHALIIPPGPSSACSYPVFSHFFIIKDGARPGYFRGYLFMRCRIAYFSPVPSRRKNGPVENEPRHPHRPGRPRFFLRGLLGHHRLQVGSNPGGEEEHARLPRFLLGDEGILPVNAQIDRFKDCPLASLFKEGYRETEHFLSADAADPCESGDLRSPRLSTDSSAIENIGRSLRKISSQETDKLERNIGFLATTGSTTPFIGLFGTVWGIMIAFRNIGLAGSTSLDIVAPGISEALITTAIGLAVAIPAVIGYNYIQGKIRGSGKRDRQLLLRFPEHRAEKPQREEVGEADMDAGNRKSGDRTPISQINVTPLVDVMLVLLIIFMVTATVGQQGITVSLPRAKSRPSTSRRRSSPSPSTSLSNLCQFEARRSGRPQRHAQGGLRASQEQGDLPQIRRERRLRRLRQGGLPHQGLGRRAAGHDHGEPQEVRRPGAALSLRGGEHPRAALLGSLVFHAAVVATIVLTARPGLSGRPSRPGRSTSSASSSSCRRPAASGASRCGPSRLAAAATGRHPLPPPRAPAPAAAAPRPSARARPGGYAEPGDRDERRHDGADGSRRHGHGAGGSSDRRQRVPAAVQDHRCACHPHENGAF